MVATIPRTDGMRVATSSCPTQCLSERSEVLRPIERFLLDESRLDLSAIGDEESTARSWES